MTKSGKSTIFSKFLASILILIIGAPSAFGQETVDQLAPAPTLELATLPAPTSTSKSAYIYVMSKPLDIKTELGLSAEMIHHAVHFVPIVITGAALAHFGGWDIALGYGLNRSVNAAVATRFISYLDLKFRTWFKTRAAKSTLKTIPHIKSVSTVLTQNMNTRGLIAKEIENRGFLVFETTEPLEAGEFDSIAWGKPQLVDDPSKTMLRLALVLNGQKAGETIDIPLTELLGQESVTNKEFENWQNLTREALTDLSPYEKTLKPNSSGALSINGSFVLSNGQINDIGTVYQGAAVKKLLKIDFVNRVSAQIKKTIPALQKKQTPSEVKLGIRTQAFKCDTAIKLED